MKKTNFLVATVADYKRLFERQMETFAGFVHGGEDTGVTTAILPALAALA